jgi:dTDP-4-amino-4,6-dideoxygalactose transaminase
MITTTRAEWAARARRLREHAMSISAVDRHASVLAPAEEYLELGFNFRMTDVQAAIGIVQLGRLAEMVARRRQLARRYAAGHAGLAGNTAVEDTPVGSSNIQSYWVVVSAPYPLERDGLLAALAAAGISARRGIMAAHRQPAYALTDTGDATLATTERLTDGTLILPLHHGLDDDDLDRVVTVIREAVR